jgi:hypothetical protein
MKNIKLILLLFIFTNCASYSRKEFKIELVKIKSIEYLSLNGKYESKPFRFFGEQSNWNTEDSLKTKNLLGVYERIQNKAPYYDKTEILDYEFIKLNFKPNGKLLYELILNDSVIKKDSVNYKVNNGMIKLKNSFYKCEGVPFLLGGCRNGRIRLGISKNNNLILNKSYDQYGALLIVFGAGLNNNSTYEYRKIE